MLLTLAGIALTGCAGDDPQPPPTGAQTSAPMALPAGAELGVDTLPLVPGGRESGAPCPYLDTGWVEGVNGQRVTGAGVDTRFADPACVYWSYPEEPQLQVIVRRMSDPPSAAAVVDWAAPVDGTEPAELPGGWVGGRGAAEVVDGAVFAVQKDTVAVVVFTNQAQSVKAEQAAQATVNNLGL